MMLSLYEKYLTAVEATPTTGCMMPYGWSNLPDLGIRWIVYSQMLQEFSQGLANIINTLTTAIPRLEAWATVVVPLSNEEKMRVTLEFIDPLATVAVCLPYAIRSRFAFAAAHLCHQANRAKQGDAWSDNLPLDQEIDMEEAQRAGAGWRKFRRFKLRLEKINGSAFKIATHDFRNAYNHRFSPHFVLGMSNIVKRTRHPETGQLYYAIGGIAPLELGEVVRLLTGERDKCYAAFKAFQALVAEHAGVIATAP